MKTTIPLLITLLFSPIAFAQRDTIPREKGENSFGIGYESGGIMKEVRYYSHTMRTGEDQQRSQGVTVFYEHQFNLGKRSGLILGIGMNATFFSNHAYFRNNRVETTNNNTDITTYYGTERDLGTWTNSYYAFDMPVLYTQTFRNSGRLHVSPYVGVKFRNIVYIADEQRETYAGSVEKDINETDTSFYMDYNVRGGTKSSRLCILPTVGFKVSQSLANGASVNLFAEYNAMLFNQVELYYTELDNTEILTIEHYQQGSPGTTTVEKTDMKYFRGGLAIFALDMSHVRVGLSYTLPHKPKTFRVYP